MRHVGRLMIAAVLVTTAACSVTPSATPLITPRPAAPTPAPSAAATATPAPPSPSTTEALHPPPCVEARFAYAAALHRLLLANCVDQGLPTGQEQVWSWDGSSWDLLADGGPDVRVVTGIAWDSARSVLVRYGGLPLNSNDCTPETWEWDITAWHQVDAAPPAVCDHAELVYDAARGVTVLFGGGDNSRTLLPGTWTWIGATWKEVATDGPTPRAHFGFVADDAHGQALLYGGYDGNAVFDDFWSWDGSAWTQLASGGPGPRSHLGLTVTTEGMLLADGATQAATFASLTDSSWSLTNGDWTELAGPGPSPRGSPNVGYDPERNAVVLYGGFDAGNDVLDDTWEWDGAWHCVEHCP